VVKICTSVFKKNLKRMTLKWAETSSLMFCETIIYSSNQNAAEQKVPAAIIISTGIKTQ
jgi:hypothetical protein